MKYVKPFTLLIFLHLAVLAVVVGVLIRQKGQHPMGKSQIVILPVDGVITIDSGSSLSNVSVEDLVHTINELRDDDHVKALVLRINSPGGSVGAVQEITSALNKFRAKGKFVVSSFADVAASGGYYIACAGDKIVSQPGTLTGSIGVIMELPNVQNLLSKIGVSMQTIKSGSMKDSGSPFRQMTEQEKQYFLSLINDAYDQFYQAVKLGRKLDDATLKPLADGRVFSGKSALSNKLVDTLGDLEDAVNLAKTLAGLENKNPEIITHKEKPSLGRLLEILGWSPLKKIESVSRTHMSISYVMK